MVGRPKNHPVPLQLIRGYAKRCNLKLGKIRQTDLDEFKRVAVYLVEIVAFPDNIPLTALSPDQLYAVLDTCFPQPSLKTTLVTFTGKSWYFNLVALGDC